MMKALLQRLVSARHRARISVALQGGRCDPQSQCAQKAQMLVALLLDEPSLCDAVVAKAVLLLDGQQRLLSERRTRALALATLAEAFLRAQEGHHAAEAKEKVLGMLEALDARIASEMYAPVLGQEEDNDDDRLHLLVHLGRGVEYLKARHDHHHQSR